jgi:4'-phosphopantetheinyl transferase
MSANRHSWPVALYQPNIAANEIHVWRIDLSGNADPPGALTNTLSEAEKARADRFLFEIDKRKFLLRRAAQRKIIAGYLRILPNAVAFSATTSGQPILADERLENFKFSLSHSGDLALLAVAQGLCIGVDVQLERAFDEMAAIVQRYFSLEEQREFFALPAADRTNAFYCGWTRKEAFLKAIGQGLAFGMNHFSVTLNPNEPARLVSGPEGHLPISHWSLYSLHPRPGFAGALAVEGTCHRMECWQYDSGFNTQF